MRLEIIHSCLEYKVDDDPKDDDPDIYHAGMF